MWWLRALALLALIWDWSGSTAAFNMVQKKEQRDRKKDRFKTTSSFLSRDSNLCTMEGNSAALHCVCIGGAPPVNTTSAECWIFTGVSKEHGVWSLFATQPHITQLKFLVRPQGQFTFVPTKGLRHLTHLKALQITYATISEIHQYAFANITTLEELALSRNQIVTLAKYSFAHLVNLTDLNLEENRIAEIRRDVFIDLPKLQRLFFAHNNLSVLQEGAFRQLAHLLELELDTNYISTLTRDTFTGLGELRRLDLSYNRITMLGDLTFSELWVLEPLDVIKTRRMNAKPGEFQNLLDLVLFTAKSGPLEFFKGYVPSFLRLGPQTIFTFIFLEQLRIRFGYLPSNDINTKNSTSNSNSSSSNKKYD